MRRIRAYVYTAVTTAIVLVFALAEWVAERFVAAHSRAAGTAIEIAIVLLATLIFRPIHQRVDAAVDAAFDRRKREALAQLARLRRELTSYDDAAQVLRRTIEAVDLQPEVRGCAVYVRRQLYRAEASSFDEALAEIAVDDPLVVRLRSSGAPALLASMRSAAPSTHAFPMTAAGDLIGFLCVRFTHGEADADELQALSGTAHDLAVALTALDPQLRPGRPGTPNNIPADLPHVIGRERELAEIKAALAQSRLVTVTGPGGVGKTIVALRCAADALGRREHGAWFVSLAPIADGKLIAPTLLGVLDAGTSDDGDALEKVFGHLRTRDALIVLDNCEQVVAEAASVVKRILASCPRVAVLATSRELLRVEGEQVYQLGALRADAAFALFAERAAAVSAAFDTQASADAVRRICERLDYMPLAIELASARVRTLSASEILERLHERFRLLAGGTRTATPRQQTLEAPIQWSYDLLPQDEQLLFRRLGVFRGSFTLAAATALCAEPSGCDEFAVLDRLTSLADKSLINVRLGSTTRYRLLETIREFATRKAAEAGEHAANADAHAAHFGAVAAQAYHEFDTRMPPGWLGRLTPDIDNFRAALEWTLEGGGDNRIGAALAANAAPIFLRMGLLAEGLHWCEMGAMVDGVEPEIAGRILYGASMMHNNALAYRNALDDARRAVVSYRRSSDERGLVRALSQVAHQSARSGGFEEAKAAAQEAIGRARELGQPRLLIAVLRRCAISLPPADIERARALFAEALAAARSAQETEEACYVLQWWGVSEAAAGCYERAMELAAQALQTADADMQLYLESDAAGYALAFGALGKAAGHARRALVLAARASHPALLALAMSYCAPVHAESQPAEGARIFGYAQARLRALAFDGDASEHAALHNAHESIRGALDGVAMEPLMAEGAELSQERVLEMLFASSALGIAVGMDDAARHGIVA